MAIFLCYISTMNLSPVARTVASRYFKVEIAMLGFVALLGLLLSKAG
jgi:hypothetical protein